MFRLTRGVSILLTLNSRGLGVPYRFIVSITHSLQIGTSTKSSTSQLFFFSQYISKYIYYIYIWWNEFCNPGTIEAGDYIEGSNERMRVPAGATKTTIHPQGYIYTTIASGRALFTVTRPKKSTRGARFVRVLVLRFLISCLYVTVKSFLTEQTWTTTKSKALVFLALLFFPPLNCFHSTIFILILLDWPHSNPDSSNSDILSPNVWLLKKWTHSNSKYPPPKPRSCSATGVLTTPPPPILPL